MNRLASAGITLTLIIAGLLDLLTANGTGLAPLPGPFGLAAAALVLVARRDQLSRTRLRTAGIVIGGASVLLTPAECLGWPGHTVATWSLLETVSLALLLGVLARRWAQGMDTLALGAVAAALVAGPWRLREPDAVLFSLLVALGALAVLAVGLLRRADDLRAAQAVLAARDAERRQIARDLHDDAAHHLTGIIVTAQAALTTAGDLATCRAAFSQIEITGVLALASMRGLVGVLRTPGACIEAELDVARWPADLHDMVERFGRRSGLDTSISVDSGDLPAPYRQAVRRVVQESLTNVKRHADQATCVAVTVRRQSTSVEVTVRDDGRDGSRHGNGGGAVTGGGFGLVGVEERAAALGGHASAGRSGTGWCVQMHLPLPSSLPPDLRRLNPDGDW